MRKTAAILLGAPGGLYVAGVLYYGLAYFFDFFASFFAVDLLYYISFSFATGLVLLFDSFNIPLVVAAAFGIQLIYGIWLLISTRLILKKVAWVHSTALFSIVFPYFLLVYSFGMLQVNFGSHDAVAAASVAPVFLGWLPYS